MANYNIDSLTYGSDNYTFSIPYGTCTTSGGTDQKIVECSNFLALETGSIIAVKFTNGISYSPSRQSLKTPFK